MFYARHEQPRLSFLHKHFIWNYFPYVCSSSHGSVRSARYNVHWPKEKSKLTVVSKSRRARLGIVGSLLEELGPSKCTNDEEAGEGAGTGAGAGGLAALN